jgi:hypothetical protein
MLIASSLVRGRAIGAPASIAASAQTHSQDSGDHHPLGRATIGTAEVSSWASQMEANRRCTFCLSQCTSCRIAASRYRRVPANRSIGSMRVLQPLASRGTTKLAPGCSASMLLDFREEAGLNKAEERLSWHSGAARRIIPQCRLPCRKLDLSPSD